MAEARVVIDLKEGVIELEGPVDFVRHYLEIDQPTLKRLPREAAAGQEKPKRSSRRGSVAKAKRVYCTEAIQNERGWLF